MSKVSYMVADMQRNILFCNFFEIRTRFIIKNRYDLGLINMKSSSLILDEKSAWSFNCLIFEAKEPSIQNEPGRLLFWLIINAK